MLTLTFKEATSDAFKLFIAQLSDILVLISQPLGLAHIKTGITRDGLIRIKTGRRLKLGAKLSIGLNFGQQGLELGFGQGTIWQRVKD